MTAGLEEMGFGLLGVPRPPDTTELERQAGVLESLGRSQASAGDDGARAYRLAGANAGAATDALAEHVTGQAGVLGRSASQAHSAALGAGAAQVAWKTVKWAGGMLIGLAGMAGLAALTPQGRALIKPLLRPVAHRVQHYLRTATRLLGQIYNRLTQRLRGTPVKAPAVPPRPAYPPAYQRGPVQTSAGRRAVTQAQGQAARAGLSARQAAESMKRAETRLQDVETHVYNAKHTVNTRLSDAYNRGEIDAATRTNLARQALASHPYLDDMTRWHLSRQAERLQQIESQLGRHVTGHLDDARRRADNGLGIARENGLDTSDLQRVRDNVRALDSRRSDMAERAYLANQDIRGPFEIQTMYRI
ncbi:hypothetical protein E1267_41285 [Nonomuraea longispora]|uniref:Uncharacterized protein n=1 Tax=Nonomuraea longispora TaxID=1848320 RepID=A0A4R4MJW2_9ACTN|nr:hypothetical protein [Nonomuraea longispora]TDB96140.1 hypothetical protein E1267_41285 [Nonomuraea longispora]